MPLNAEALSYHGFLRLSGFVARSWLGGEVVMQRIQFETIWNNYPADNPCIDPKTGAAPVGYENQCAMRVGYALGKSGISFNSFRGGRCPISPRKGPLVSSAQQLANWLKRKPFSGCPDVEEFTGKDVFFKN